MKKSDICPLEVVGFKVAVAEADVAGEASELDAFDPRRDLSVKNDSFNLSINLIAANIRRPENGGVTGVHRPIAITVADKMGNRLLASKSLWVTIPKGNASRKLHTEIPLCADSIDFDTMYVIYLRDVHTDTHLVEKEVAFYEERNPVPIADDWIVESASIAPYFSERKYRSFQAKEQTAIKVRFDLARLNKFHTSDSPEMEIRIFFPDGSAARAFCSVGFDSFDHCDMGKYRAQVCVKASKAAMGVCYAEILCLGKAIAGFVFSINDKAIEGVWTADQLQLMDSCAAGTYAERYKELIERIKGDEDNDLDNPLISDSDFERALDEFISSQLPEEGPDSGKIEGE